MALTHRFGDLLTIVIGEQLRLFDLDSGAAPVWGHAVAGLAATVGDWWLAGPTMPRSRVATYVTDLVWCGFSGPYVAKYGPVPLLSQRPARESEIAAGPFIAALGHS
jgi:hypothetical protein